MKISFNKIKIYEHIAFWLFMYLFLFDYYFIAQNWTEALGLTLAEVITYMVIVYINLLLLIPKLLSYKKHIYYILSVIITIIAYVLVMRWSGLEQHFYIYGGWRNVFSMVFNTTLFLLISTLYWYFKQWQKERELYLQIKTDKLEAELNFLRSQISPHFIFNTLNNIYSLAIQNSANTATMVAKLSTILRYILYEGSQGNVFLSKEIQTLKEYIELHLLRKPLSKNIDFIIDGNISHWKISPMLLINFVENTFKHSYLEYDASAWIKIYCSTNIDGEFIFITENKSAESNKETQHEGIGLQNVKRQLELNYPNKHRLEISNVAHIFKVQLIIQLENT